MYDEGQLRAISCGRNSSSRHNLKHSSNTCGSGSGGNPAADISQGGKRRRNLRLQNNVTHFYFSQNSW